MPSVTLQDRYLELQQLYCLLQSKHRTLEKRFDSCNCVNVEKTVEQLQYLQRKVDLMKKKLTPNELAEIEEQAWG